MKRSQAQQRGVTTLAISLILLVVLTMMTLYSAQVGVLKQRIVANEIREREARMNADALIDSGLQFVFANRRHLRSTAAGGWLEGGSVRWSTCAGVALPCGDGLNAIYGGDFVFYSATGRDITAVSDANSQLHLVATADGAGPSDDAVYTLIAVSTADDATGQSIVRQSFWLTPLLAAAPDAPLVTAGGANLTGTFHVVANPNGGGENVPISVWTAGGVATGPGGASWQTCQPGAFNDAPSGGCVGDAGDPLSGQLSNDGDRNTDILDNDPNFPDDLFQYVFGTSISEWEDFKANNVPDERVIANCSGLSTASFGLYWVEGACSIGSDIGSRENPVILILENGNLSITGTRDIFGIIFALETPGSTGGSVQLGGGATLYGALLTNRSVELGAGNYRAVYDAEVLQNLTDSEANKRIGKVPGSWADFL